VRFLVGSGSGLNQCGSQKLLLGMLLPALILGEDESRLVREVFFRLSGLLCYAVLTSAHSWAFAALRAYTRGVCTGEAEALVATVCFKNQSGPDASSGTLLVLHQEVRGSQTKSEKQQGGSCTHVVCLSLLNRPAGGDRHTQLRQHFGSMYVRSARLSRLDCINQTAGIIYFAGVQAA
jgi:hypothetical protein